MFGPYGWCGDLFPQNVQNSYTGIHPFRTDLLLTSHSVIHSSTGSQYIGSVGRALKVKVIGSVGRALKAKVR